MNLVESYNLVDLFILGTLFISMILGIWKGFIKSLTALAGLILGVVFALKYYPVVQPYLNKISALDAQISTVLSVIIVFIGVQIIFVVIRRILDKLLDLTRLTWLDRVFGAAMGVAGGFLIVAASVQVLLIGIPDWPLIKTSKLIHPVDQLTTTCLNYAPKQARDQAQSFFAKWKGIQDVTPVLPQRQTAPLPKTPTAPPGTVK